MFDSREDRVGVFAVLVAMVLVFALTAMAFTALEAGRSNEPGHLVSSAELWSTFIAGFGSEVFFE